MELHKVIDLQRDKRNGFRIGLDIYPIFDDAYRLGLNQKIIDHYWNREIGLETVSQFVFNLRRKMNEIMPQYNQLYKSTQLQFDPLLSIDLATIRDDTANEKTTANNTQNTTTSQASKARTTHLDTPQTELQGDEDYASSGDVSQSNTVGAGGLLANSNGESDTTMNGKSSTKGRQGSAARLLTEYRSTLINVDMMVVSELNELFMNVWDNGEEFSSRHGFYALGGFYG